MSDLSQNEINAFNALPTSWSARRDQPNGDHLFSGRMEAQHAFSNQTDKAVQYVREALAFSEIIKDGFAPDGGFGTVTLTEFGATARGFIAQGRNQHLPETLPEPQTSSNTDDEDDDE